MAIIKMKALRLIAADSCRTELMRDLSRLGCVELAPSFSEQDISNTNPLETNASVARASLNEVKAAYASLCKYAEVKRGLLTPRVQTKLSVLFDKGEIEESVGIARGINELTRELSTLYTETGRLMNRRESLMPWGPLDVPLETENGVSHAAFFAVCPATVSFEQIRLTACEVCPDAQIFLASEGREQIYFFVLCHIDDEQTVVDALKQVGFSKMQFKDISGTAAENVKRLEKRLDDTETRREEIIAAIKSKATSADRLLIATDALESSLARETALEGGRATDRTIVLSGWVPEREENRLIKVLEKYDVAYELREPTDEEEPPVSLYNSRLVAPFSVITDMYSPPTYREIDPNPVMAPFFTLFFGIMLSDAAYGLILMAVGIFALKKLKPRGGFNSFMHLAVICGAATVFWGALFGGWFGDAIPQVYTMLTGKAANFSLALWFNPLEDPMKMLVFSLALGGIHIFAGMAISAYAMIKDGKILDAIFDVGFWWLLLIGAVVAFTLSTNVGLIMLGAGALGLLLTQGRHNKSFLKKITGGLSALYGVTSYLGDILSYSRLLALSLATGVIAQVMNTMGVMTGPIFFIVIFLIGHTFNIAVNLIGTFVHSARLQYVEFFGKFYQGGGTSFKPLNVNIKHIDIIKEDN